MYLIDSHAHLTANGVFENIEAVVSRAIDAGVRSIVNICTDRVTMERGLELIQRYPFIYNTAATTPHDVAKEGVEVFPSIREQALAGKLIAIGETGLDYYYNHSPRDIQQYFLRRYLHLALECQLPVVIHCREAFCDFFHILDQEYVVNGKHQKGVLHCFTGTISEAEKVFERGWYLSISGIATFKKNDALREVIRMAPLEQLLIETDTPFLAPQSHRGKPNEPAFVVEVATLVAGIKGFDLEKVAEITRTNAENLFRITSS